MAKSQTMQYFVKFHDKEIMKLASRASDDSKQETADAVAKEAAGRVRWPHGEIVGEVRHKSGKSFGVVAAKFADAILQEYGTGLYGTKKKRIKAKGGGFLRWRDDDGTWHQVKSVSGMQPHPFLRPALEAKRTEMIEILKGKFRKFGMGGLFK